MFLFAGNASGAKKENGLKEKMAFDTIDLLDGNVFQVTWDLGRRCNYDCSYCPAHRHDNFSRHASLDELKASAEFMFEYVDTYMQYRTFKSASVSFTGGEPTVNPNFLEFVTYLKKIYNERYSSRFDCSFSLTSNGAFGRKIANGILSDVDHITISYHAEADKKLKDKVLSRIRQFHASGKSMNINVMFHAGHFEECVDLCNTLDQENIKYVPRVIGEEANSKPTFAHKYKEHQIQWMADYWKVKKKDNHNGLGLNLGRPCCGSRTMCLSSCGEERTSKFVDFREFQGWSCSVNWFFLHIEQQTDSVYHHQTCQARFDQTRGPIGKLSEGSIILETLKENLKNDTLPTIICPKKICGCGLCAPKSSDPSKYQQIMIRHITPNK